MAYVSLPSLDISFDDISLDDRPSSEKIQNEFTNICSFGCDAYDYYDFETTVQIPIDDSDKMHEFILRAKNNDGLFKKTSNEKKIRKVPFVNFLAKTFGYDDLAKLNNISDPCSFAYIEIVIAGNNMMFHNDFILVNGELDSGLQKYQEKILSGKWSVKMEFDNKDSNCKVHLPKYIELVAKINKLTQYFRDYEQYETGRRTKKAIRKEES